LFCIENLVELLDLPDELILAIMNKIKPQVILLYSMIGIKNIRLEQLALDQCHSLDLTYNDSDCSSERIIRRFIYDFLPYNFNYIESLTINVMYMKLIDNIASYKYDYNDTCLNFKHLKLMGGYLHSDMELPFRDRKLYLIVHFLFESTHFIRQKLT
jgi:hypothetical protein